jgi:mRNA-degrading endonuclease YafQ of YafQ-DinJ toxin-antitoxin module
MLKVRYSSRFKKDFKTIVKRGYDVKHPYYLHKKNSLPPAKRYRGKQALPALQHDKVKKQAGLLL